MYRYAIKYPDNSEEKKPQNAIEYIKKTRTDTYTIKNINIKND